MEILGAAAKIVCVLLLLSIVCAMGLSFLLMWSNTHPPRYRLTTTPARFGLAFEEVTFSSEDGVRLQGWFLPAPGRKGQRGPAIVICHGLGASKSDFVDLAADLSRRGFHLLLFDFRAHGDSGGRSCSLGYLERRDLAAALGLLREREEVDPDRIGVYGFSLGGAVAIMVAAERREIRAVAADSSYSSLREEAAHVLTEVYHFPRFPFLTLGSLSYRLLFGVDLDEVSPMAAIGKLAGRPLFLIAGVGDETIPESHAGFLYEAAGEPKELWLIREAVHGGTLGAAGMEYQRRLEEFFARALGQSQH